jgi:hypothetical protein
VSEQIIDDVDVAVLSGLRKGFVLISVATQVVRVEHEHAVHNRQSTMGSVIKK